MQDVHCYGIIPLKEESGRQHVLLIKHKKGGYWAFPKGHSEQGEDAYQAASRELQEETGLKVVRFLPSQPVQEHYHFVSRGEQIHKTVTYFLAEVDGDLALQKEEIVDAKWVLLENAEKEITFKEGKNLCRRVIQQCG